MLDDAIDASEASLLSAELQQLYKAGRFGDASTSFRGDSLLFMREQQATAARMPALAATVRLLKGIAHELSRLHSRGGPLTAAPRVQVACYPPGAGYKVHQDVKLDEYEPNGRTNWRVFTVICYANADWRSEHGGCLRLHHAARTIPGGFVLGGRPPSGQPAFTDVAPHAGRVVVFDSLVPHEVLPARRERFAVTLWVWREDGEEEKYCLS